MTSLDFPGISPKATKLCWLAILGRRDLSLVEKRPRMSKIQSSFLALGLTILLLSTTSSSQPLWNGTIKGMAPKDVIESVQGAEYTDSGGRLANGATVAVSIPDFTVVNNSFEVRFFFKNDALVQVTLHLNGERPYGHAKVVFNSLVQVLRSKYGDEVSFQERENDRAVATWMTKDNVNVDLYLASLGQKNSILNLNYQSRVADEMDKI